MTTALVQYGKLLLARWRWVMWGVLITLSAMTVMMIVARPVYRSDATVLVRTPGDVSRVQDGGDSFARARADTYAELAKGTGVSARVVADLGLDISAEQFSSRVDAQTRPNTALLDIAVRGPSTAEAQRSVTVLISELQATVKTLETVPGSVIPRAELVVADPPRPAERIWVWGLPVSAVLIGLVLLGAFAGALVAVLRAMFSRPASGGDSDAAESGGGGRPVLGPDGHADAYGEDQEIAVAPSVDGASLLTTDESVGGVEPEVSSSATPAVAEFAVPVPARADGDLMEISPAGDAVVDPDHGGAGAVLGLNGASVAVAERAVSSSAPAGQSVVGMEQAGDPDGVPDVAADLGESSAAPQPNRASSAVPTNGVSINDLEALVISDDATFAQDLERTPGGRHRRKRRALTAKPVEATSDRGLSEPEVCSDS